MFSTMAKRMRAPQINTEFVHAADVHAAWIAWKGKATGDVTSLAGVAAFRWFMSLTDAQRDALVTRERAMKLREEADELDQQAGPKVLDSLVGLPEVKDDEGQGKSRTQPRRASK